MSSVTAPADKSFKQAINKSFLLPDSSKNFARNALVLIEPLDGPPISSVADLTKDEVRRIAIGNPRTVPAGQYTVQTFNSLKLLPAINPKLIYAEDVRQVLDYVMRGEVDAGFVYASDALMVSNRIKTVAETPETSHEPIVYPIAIVRESRRPDQARQFVELLLSPEGQNILVKHGFVSVAATGRGQQ